MVISGAGQTPHSGGSRLSFYIPFMYQGFEWATEKQQQQMLFPWGFWNLFGYSYPQQPGVWTISGNSKLGPETLWCLFCWVPVPECPGSAKSYIHPHSFSVSLPGCPGSAKSYCSHILIVSQSSSQEGGHFWTMRSLWSLPHTHSERWALSPAPRSAQRNRSCLFAALCEIHGKTIDGT